MAAPPLTLRCTRCGLFLAAPNPGTAVAAWFACPHCHAPVPVVAPRDPPPLFSWEVYPHLYPPLPAPRGASPQISRVAVVALVVLTVLLLGLAGFLVASGANSLEPVGFRVGGHVVSENGAPMDAATVNVTGENQFQRTLVTDRFGDFSVAGVPGGAITVNVSKFGYSTTAVEIFLSKTYRASSGDPTSLAITLFPGPSNVSSTRIDTAFPNLETLVATLWSGALVLGVAATVTGVGAVAMRRESSSPVAIAGGVAGLLAPFSFLVLGVTTVYPMLTIVGALLVGLGVLVATLAVLPLALTGPAPDP